MRGEVRVVWAPCSDCADDDIKCGGQKGSAGTNHFWIYSEMVGVERFGLYSGHNAIGEIRRFSDLSGARDHAQELVTESARAADAAIPRIGL